MLFTKLNLGEIKSHNGDEVSDGRIAQSKTIL